MATARKAKRPDSDETAFSYVTLIGMRPADLQQLLRDVERGLPFKALEHFSRAVPLTMAQVLDLVQIAPRTLARRKSEGRLAPDESDRLLRSARLLARTIELFGGDARSAAGWLQAPQLAFGGAVPLDVARTELGSREVEILVERLEQGVYV